MPWTFVANCHVQAWKNNANIVSPPALLPDYDGPGQLLTPALKSPSANPWRGRLVLPSTAIVLGGADINAPATVCWVAIKDDATGQVWGYWQIVDLSVSTRPVPAGPGTFSVDALFLDFILHL